MEYFLHSSLARYADALKQLEHDYGLAAVGFFWKAVELIFAYNGEAPFAAVLALRSRPLRYTQVETIVKQSGLFLFDGIEARVRLNTEVRNGIYKMPHKKKAESSSRTYTGACTDDGTDAGTEAIACMDAGGDAGGDASRQASVPAVPSEIERKEEECENNICATHTREGPKEAKGPEESKELQLEQQLQTFLASRCPTLLEMEEPLTVDEYLELRRRYDRHEIEQVLLDMHNDVRTVNARSCFAMADKWLRVRSTRR